MPQMTHHELTIFFTAVGVLLLFARLFGEAAKRFNQPAVLGEILAGIVLGPTVLGAIAPAFQHHLFPIEGNFPIALQGLTALAITLFLLVAGLEVDLSAVLRQGKTSIVISLFGMIVPFAFGFGAAYGFPNALGAEPDSDRLIFALFVGTALCITALPVIAKILLDLNIFRSDFGMVLVSVAVIGDLLGWMLFAIILSMIGEVGDRPFSVHTTIGLTIVFTILVLTVGRFIIDRTLPAVQAYTTWPGGVLGFAITGAILCAAFTEWIGIHSIFGAFLFGVALGDSVHLREKTRHTLENFISFIFAPIFFASIGLHVDFIANFDLMLVVIVLVIATLGKLIGCGLASRWVGYSWRESLAVGFGMNARGAMEIILALLALEVGLISPRMFVAMVIMALVTAIFAGTLMQRFLNREKPFHFYDFMSPAGFIANLQAADRKKAIEELAPLATKSTHLGAAGIAAAVWEREQLISTGLGNGIAIPHARIEGLKTPIIVCGLSGVGVDFDAPDGEPANLIFLILTPKENTQIQLEILSSIGKTFQNHELFKQVQHSTNYVEFLAQIKSNVK